MATRLRMTNVDYVAIAVSPALVMALVGSLVFFLIEVMYVGGYSLRLNYIFALFVFATVLIARIAIELGAELAAMYSLPLGILTYLALLRFVEHRSSVSWLINLALLAIVWWCAHKLTWDCTVIDDNEDSSGEGLLGKAGLDDSEDRGKDAAPIATANELLADQERAAEEPWWQRLFRSKPGPHMPGVWVFYFSLAALPLFGIGQRWIPAGDVSRRRYAFCLLAIYVAAALSLLVTTSFLGLRRYLRQRRIEMPAPMAATWISLGAILILLVMFSAALLPRPKAEYALSQVPWQARSPDGLTSSRYRVGGEGTVDPSAADRAPSDNQNQAPAGADASTVAETSQAAASDGGEGEPQGNQQPNQQSERADSPQAGQGAPPSRDEGELDPRSDSRAPSADRQSDAQRSPSDSQPGDSPLQSAETRQSPPGANGTQQTKLNAEQQAGEAEESEAASQAAVDSPPKAISPTQLLQTFASSLLNLIKLIIYFALALGLLAAAWRYRREIAQAIADIVRSLREFWARLFGRQPVVAVESEALPAAARRRSFREFTDPFLTDRHRRLEPVELVRYTFEAFEAWAGDHGRPRTPDQTPQELVRAAVKPKTALHEQASLLVRLYGEAAYASKTISRDEASRLRVLWHAMQSAPPPRENAPAVTRATPTAPTR